MIVPAKIVSEGGETSAMMFGGGPRLFAGIGPDVGVEFVVTIASPRVTYVRLAAHKP